MEKDRLTLRFLSSAANTTDSIAKQLSELSMKIKARVPDEYRKTLDSGLTDNVPKRVLLAYDYAVQLGLYGVYIEEYGEKFIDSWDEDE